MNYLQLTTGGCVSKSFLARTLGAVHEDTTILTSPFGDTAPIRFLQGRRSRVHVMRSGPLGLPRQCVCTFEN